MAGAVGVSNPPSPAKRLTADPPSPPKRLRADPPCPWRVLEEAGLQESLEDFPAGGAVYRHVRVEDGPAAGWEIQGRLEMDRHDGKESSRAPRWKFIHPDNTAYSAFSARSSTSPAVCNSGISSEAFEQLGVIQSSLKKALSKRRDELQKAHKLIDQKFEADWQDMLTLRKLSPNDDRALQELRRKTSALAQGAPANPEWRPPSWAGKLPTQSSTAESATDQIDVMRTGRRRGQDAFVNFMLKSFAVEQETDAEEQPDVEEESDGLGEDEQRPGLETAASQSKKKSIRSLIVTQLLQPYFVLLSPGHVIAIDFNSGQTV